MIVAIEDEKPTSTKRMKKVKKRKVRKTIRHAFEKANDMPEDEKSEEMADMPSLNWERQPSSELPPESTKHSENVVVSRKRKPAVNQEQQARRQML